MPEITLKNIKELLQKDIREIVQVELKKGLKPLVKDIKQIKSDLGELKGQADRTTALLSNFIVDMQDVPKNIEEILKRQRHTETHIDWLAAYHKNDEAKTIHSL